MIIPETGLNVVGILHVTVPMKKKCRKSGKMEKCRAHFFIALWGVLVDDSYRDTPQGTQKNPDGYV